tara:strand:+ start:1118 stop:2332 length:1215 start_codon:yes stop_codon:yes gene_type:complete
MSEQDLSRKIHFEPSTIETIDKSVLNYMEKLDLFTNSNDGWRKVPIVWASAERAYQVKKNKELRDGQGMLKFPIISIKRNSIVKDMGSKGVFQGNVPEIDKKDGGSLAVGRVVYQDKTSKFANADALRLHNQSNYPRPNPKTVYRTVIAPMPVNVTVMYDITIRTEYQQQMNELMLPFITTPGTINFVALSEGEHRFEGFIQGDFQNNDNLADFSSDERKFEVKIPLKVIGYLVGQEDNRDKPHYSVRENAVEVKIPRERISLNEIPEHEFGSYYGLAGLPEPVFIAGFNAPFLFSNVPAAAQQSAGDGGASGNIVTTTNFTEILEENLVIREVMKRSEEPVPDPPNRLTVTTSQIKENTESLFLNGSILAPGTLNDYTIAGQEITLNFNLDKTDVVFITYIRK